MNFLPAVLTLFSSIPWNMAFVDYKIWFTPQMATRLDHSKARSLKLQPGLPNRFQGTMSPAICKSQVGQPELYPSIQCAHVWNAIVTTSCIGTLPHPSGLPFSILSLIKTTKKKMGNPVNSKSQYSETTKEYIVSFTAHIQIHLRTEKLHIRNENLQSSHQSQTSQGPNPSLIRKHSSHNLAKTILGLEGLLELWKLS